MHPDGEHDDLHRLLNDSLDGELDDAGRAELDRRLAADAGAVKEADAWRRLDALVRNAERVSVSERAFLAEHRRRRLTAPTPQGHVRVLRWLAPVAAAAVILVAVFVSLPEPGIDAPTTVVRAPDAAPTELAPRPSIDIHYSKPPQTPAADEPRPLIVVKFARRDIAVTPPAAQTADDAKNAVTFAVISAGGQRQSRALAAVAPPI